MASTRDIKRRQKSVGNTKQVTKAMEMVAASKMRKAQIVAIQSRPYAEKTLSILSHIKERQPDLKNIYLDGPSAVAGPGPATKRDQVPLGKLLAVVVTSDKGLCGGLNGAVIRKSSKIFEQYKKDGYAIELVLIGAKSKSYFERMGFPILETFKGVGDYIELDEVRPISKFIREKYKTPGLNRVIATYTEFISTLKQKVESRQILPIENLEIKNLKLEIEAQEKIGTQAPEHIFEPDAKTILRTLVPFLIDIHVYHIILESNASEHSARMVAMRNASDSAESILNELTLSYNKARQAAITGEITEITAGVEAIHNSL